ncbi:glycoside hydrolase family 61 protein [Ceratobasidium sp. AG-Ba]|nr:glycoside hydrolase family 61 protein [Ceratobasidium sp. AG-Ba]
MLDSILLLLAAISGAVGHGYVQEIVTSGGTYSGFLPWSDPYYPVTPERIVRKIPGNYPIEDLTLIDIQCNGKIDWGQVGSAPAPIFGLAEAGTNVALNWTEWPDSHAGPIITYMARAPIDITKWQPELEPVWFKVDESGLVNGTKWAATDILKANKSIYTFKIPEWLQPGQYIVRHEIIALHGAFNYPGVQVYPSCIQLQITGSGSKIPPASAMVAFPGAYTPDTPGIVYNMYGGNTTYPIRE